ncbi:Hpt protein [Thermobaculum terrenum ATCC BAA-798]|uniref:Hpt protein n=1 Tax=Thermobaculum terrenum (strain ATCC BAA-798 / CCMEE 7001 / YNP1) TaxID=525904 RepID=D1CH72_THET1|nr:Hpt domain-containing protein [Thermobaculum terrenum]ACZ43093.1 Hpt protein [Thermobaculum terrenum ATCC BAA-798]
MREESVLSRQALEAIREMAGSEEVFGELIEMFITDSQERLATIERALVEQDAEALGSAAHALKGSCANFGAAHLEELCRQLQEMGYGGDLEGARALLPQVRLELERLHAALARELGSRDA